MNTKEKIAVMQAWVDGKKVQYRSTLVQSDWHDVHCAEPPWSWNEYEYRIKPEPREWVVGITAEGVIYSGIPAVGLSTIKVREVLE